MNKTYYEILEVDQNASEEIIEKAYKTLIKKYHPDLQQGNLKLEYEEKIKFINESYEILSNCEKRKKYDSYLSNNDDMANLINENSKLKEEINYLKNNQTSNINQNLEKDINKKIENAVNKAYQDAYIQDLKNRGYKIKYKKTFKDFLALFLTILVLIALGFILWQIPFIKNYLINLYNNNGPFNFLIDFFINIFK